MEKAWPARGSGWIGKHGVLVSRPHGSWFTLSVMVINRSVDRYHEPHPRLAAIATFACAPVRPAHSPLPACSMRGCVFPIRQWRTSTRSRSASCGTGRAGLRLRRLPGSLPLQSQWAASGDPGRPRGPLGSCRQRRLRRSVATSLPSGRRHPHGACGLRWLRRSAALALGPMAACGPRRAQAACC